MKIAIVGGGAAGLVAALEGARKGAQVTIYERGERVGRKLLATGNGQCNLDHLQVSVKNYFGKHTKFAAAALEAYPTERNLRFWEELGLALTIKENGRVYPRSLQAAAVVDILRLQCAAYGVVEKTSCEINEIKKEKERLWLYSNSGERFWADAVVVAAGGAAASGVGGTESGYRLLEKAGHTCRDLLPAIVQLKTDPAPKAMGGQKITGKASLWMKDRILREETGEILFTEYGLSGVPILQLSGQCAQGLRKKQHIEIALDLCCEKTEQELVDFLRDRRERLGAFPLGDFLVGFLPKRIGQQYMKEACSRSLAERCITLSEEEILWLAELLKGKRYTVTGTMGLKNAQVTLGGMDTAEFCAETMESNKVAGLYAVGEVLDITGECGGYNLHWAVSSARLAIASIMKNGGEA